VLARDAKVHGPFDPDLQGMTLKEADAAAAPGRIRRKCHGPIL
jgi:hypothetical protein